MEDLQRENSMPLYLQMVERIRSQILSGELKAHEQIMTEKELSEQYGVSRITVRNALDVLTEEGLLIRKRGKGTFVAGKRMTRSLNTLMSFTQSCEQQDIRPGARFLAADIIDATPEDIRVLDLQGDDKVLRIKRIRCADDAPVLIEENHFPRRYAYLLSEDLSGSLYETLKRHGVNMHMGTMRMAVDYASREDANTLEVKENDALLLIHDVGYDAEGNAVYRGKRVINTERYSFSLTLYAQE